ncbi:MAG TPA: nitroreductase family protein [Candidatus Dormibacteraeota bacterium]|nr:nitroreductase family protein [Candidatus Dormibacteraeota bacterium]
MTPEKLLTTTRSVRRRLDFERPVPRELLLECVRIAVQAPTGGNRQGWHWMFVTNEEKKKRIGELYRDSYYPYAESRPQFPEGDPRREQQTRVKTSSDYLAERFGEVPVMVIPCIAGRAEAMPNMVAAAVYGSIIPAAWSFMLAARLHNLACAYTTLHLVYEREVAEVLGIDYDQYMQVALLTVGFYQGESFKPANRMPLDAIVHWDSW